MNTINKIYVFISLLLLGCTGSVKNDINEHYVSYPVQLNIAEALEKQKKFELTNHVKKIEYIPLTGLPGDVFVNRWHSIYKTEKYILIGGWSEVLLFGPDGKYIRQIGRHGRGPGEYIGILSCAIDSNTDEIFVYEAYSGRTLVFDIAGKLVTSGISVKYADRLDTAGDNLLYSGYAIHGFQKIPDECNQITVKDKAGITIDSIRHPLHGFDHEGSYYFSSGNFPITFFNQEPLIIGAGDNIIYATNIEGAIYTRYVLDYGRYLIGQEKLMTNPTINFSYYIEPSGSPIETCQFLFMRFSFREYEYIVIYNKFSGELFATKYDLEKIDMKRGQRSIKGFGFANDFDGGPVFFPPISTRTNPANPREVISLIEAYELVLQYTPEKMNSLVMKYGDNAKSLVELIGNLTREDNPVLMVVTLK